MSAAIPVSAELAAWVAARRAKSQSCGRTGFSAKPDLLDEVTAGFATGEIETVPAAQRHTQSPPNDFVTDFRRRYGFWGIVRRLQRSPDRQRSYERRHRLAWSGPLPGFLAARLTVADTAVARIVADEHRSRKVCDLSIAEIAARAGVCRKTAKRALFRLRTEKLVSIEERPIKGRKNLTNVVRIVSREWLCWLEKKRALQRPAGGIGGHLVAPTVTRVKQDANLHLETLQDGGRGRPPPLSAGVAT